MQYKKFHHSSFIPAISVFENDEYEFYWKDYFNIKKNDFKIINNNIDFIIYTDFILFKIPSNKTKILNVEFVIKSKIKKILTFFIDKPVYKKIVFKGDASTKNVFISGDFNDWKPKSHPLKKKKNNIWEIQLKLQTNNIYRYKLIVNDSWILDPENKRTTNEKFKNSVLVTKNNNFKNKIFIYTIKQNKKSIIYKIVGNINNLQVSSVLSYNDFNDEILTYKIKNDCLIVSIPDKKNIFAVRTVISNNKFISNKSLIYLDKSYKFEIQKKIMYFLIIDRFYNINNKNYKISDKNLDDKVNFYGGNFNGVTDKIKNDYFKKLGVNLIWLSPVNKNPNITYQEYKPPYRHFTGYHGYWPIHPKKTESKAGTETELKNLINTAHNNNIEILFDYVFHHVHKEHPYWKNKKELFGNLYLPDGKKNLRLWSEHPYTTWFEPFLPTFNFYNKKTVKLLISDTQYWINKYNIDGFRLDAVKHIPPHFWFELRNKLKNNNKRLFWVGETFKSRKEIKKSIKFNMLDSQFDFPLYDAIIDVFATENKNFSFLENELAASEKIFSKDIIMTNLIGNHDKSRFMSFADGYLPDENEPNEEEYGWKTPPQKVRYKTSYTKLKMALAFIFVIDGIPSLYYGDEIGMLGAADPDNRRKMQFKNLNIHQKNLIKFISKLSKLRKNNIALFNGERIPIYISKNIYIFIKSYLNNKIIIVFNKNKRKINLKLNNTFKFNKQTVNSKISNYSTLKITNSNLFFDLNKFSVNIFKIK